MKKIILLLIIYYGLTFTSSFSQEIEWQNTIGGSLSDELNSIQQTTDGGYILGGTSLSNISGDKTENSLGGYDYWIVKTDASGNIQWQNTIGGSNEDRLYSVQQTSDNGYISGGWSLSNLSGDKTENSMGSYDFWVVKTDSAGNIQWQNTIGGSGNDQLYTLKSSNDKGCILGGFSNSGTSGDKTENCLGIFDYWVVKIDSTGNIEWQNTIGGSGDDRIVSINTCVDGGYILGGSSNSNISGDKTENTHGDNDYWIVKIDSMGNIQWQNTIGGNDRDDLNSIQQTNDGGYIVAGTSASNASGDKTENSRGFFDFWIVKLDSSGNVSWKKTTGGSFNEILQTVKQCLDNKYIIGGTSCSCISSEKTENGWDCNYITNDYWVLKIDSIGKILWQNTIVGNNNEYCGAIDVNSDGDVIVGGYSNSNISADKTEDPMGSYDYWIIKMTGKYNSITGKCFIDTNGNNIQEAGEKDVINKQVSETNTGRSAFTQQNGYYDVAVLDSGNFSVISSLSYYNAIPATQSCYFSTFHQKDSLNDFAFQPTGVFNDLCITITPMGNFRAGFDASYMINYENVGTTTLNPTVIFFPDNDVTFVSSNPIATSVTTDSVVWNIGTLTPFQTGSILVTVHVNAGTPIGTLINSNARIEPVAGDNYPGCNYAYWEVYTTGSYDPNDIIVDQDTLYSNQFPNPPFLEYIIRFQNTGNDTAFTVKILNPVDTFKLQLNTLEFVSSSHPVNMKWIPWERNMEFKFDNILLPDSNVNEPMSHGFVRYRIKPKTTLTAGDNIENNAAIYFDFNFPVLTNTAVTEIVLPTGSPTLTLPEGEGMALAPNPVTDLLNVSFSAPLRGGKVELYIFDLYGREVFQLQTLNFNPDSYRDQTKINVSGFSQGVYIIEIEGGREGIEREVFEGIRNYCIFDINFKAMKKIIIDF